MDAKQLRALLPARKGKLIGANPDGLLFDECHNTSGISLEFIGTRGGKSSRACTMICYWPGSLAVFDPAAELGPMTWRALGALGRRVHILNPNPAPEAPWAPLVGQTNVLGWINIRDPLAEVHVHTITGLFFDEEGIHKTQSGQFFEGSAESLIACLLAHVLWAAKKPKEVPLEEIIAILRGELVGGAVGFDDLGATVQDELVAGRATALSDAKGAVPPMMADLISVRDFLFLKPADLQAALVYIMVHSPSKLARRYAGPLVGAHPETFTDIHNTCTLAARWLANDTLADMVCGDTFDIADISRDPELAVFVQLPMTTCLKFPSLPNVVFGSLLAAKMEQPGGTFPLVIIDESWMLKAQAIRQIILNGGKYRIALHMLWQSMGDLDRVWGRDTRKSFFDSAAWVALGPLGDIASAREISEACGTYGAIGYSKGDNTSMQAGTSFWSRWSRGKNLNQHPIKRHLFYSHELIQDLDRSVRLILWRSRPPAVVGAAPYFDVRELDGLVDPSPYNVSQAPPEPRWRISLRRRELPVRVT